MSYKVLTCIVCGYVYNEELGDEEHGLAPGTRWEDVPDDWECPECGAGKSDFENGRGLSPALLTSALAWLRQHPCR